MGHIISFLDLKLRQFLPIRVCGGFMAKIIDITNRLSEKNLSKQGPITENDHKTDTTVEIIPLKKTEDKKIKFSDLFVSPVNQRWIENWIFSELFC